MKRNLLLLILLSFCGTYLFAIGNDPVDKWLALVRYANLKHEEVKTACPHFPYFDFKTSDESFTNLRLNWQNKFSKEVTAFLAIEKIKKLNPSLVDLGIKKLGEDNPSMTFEYTYWTLFLNSGLTKQELQTFAPHFPFPKITSNVEQDKFLYDRVFTDFTMLFPTEFIAFMNNKQVRLGSKIYGDVFTMDLSMQSDAFKTMYIDKVENKPQFINFDSGNPELDKARYEATLKNWYFTFYRKDYYTIYDPAGYDAYIKALEDAVNHPEAGH